ELLPAFAGSFLLHPPDSIHDVVTEVRCPAYPRRAGHRFSTGVRFGPSQPYSRLPGGKVKLKKPREPWWWKNF
ncbi:MAG: hypothetical protein J7J17_03965, partial [Hadesarchaea archaeon]|nr:hypothetical protein [Hadesarchaea archaeon]